MTGITIDLFIIIFISIKFSQPLGLVSQFKLGTLFTFFVIYIWYLLSNCLSFFHFKDKPFSLVWMSKYIWFFIYLIIYCLSENIIIFTNGNKMILIFDFLRIKHQTCYPFYFCITKSSHYNILSLESVTSLLVMQITSFSKVY